MSGKGRGWPAPSPPHLPKLMFGEGLRKVRKVRKVRVCTAAPSGALAATDRPPLATPVHPPMATLELVRVRRKRIRLARNRHTSLIVVFHADADQATPLFCREAKPARRNLLRATY
jgi:hypothetical protein